MRLVRSDVGGDLNVDIAVRGAEACEPRQQQLAGKKGGTCSRSTARLKRTRNCSVTDSRRENTESMCSR